MTLKTALIAGAAGLIGNELLHLLLEGNEYDRVIAIVRNPLHLNHPKLTEKPVDFDGLDDDPDTFAVDDVFCCLGTTMKKAKTKEAMYKVDVHYPLAIAKLAKDKGAQQFLLISSLNADANSSLWYPKMKGELEQQLVQIPFASIAILRPSLLLGNRKEFRLGERTAGIVFSAISCAFVGRLQRYKAIQAKTVAAAMYRIAQLNKPGVTVYPSEQLQAICAT